MNLAARVNDLSHLSERSLDRFSSRFIAVFLIATAGTVGSSRAQSGFESEYEHALFCAASLLNGVYDRRLSGGRDIEDPKVQAAIRTQSHEWTAKAVQEGVKTGTTVQQVEDDINERSGKIQGILESGPTKEWLVLIHKAMEHCD